MDNYKNKNGVYYVIYGNTPDKNQIDGKIELTDKEINVNKDLLEKLIQTNETQQVEIKKLYEKIDVLTDYIKNQSVK